MSGFWAMGTTVSIAGTAINGINNISLPDESRDDIEMTGHASTDKYREFIPGLRDGGTVALEGHLLPADAGQTACRTNYAADAAIAEFVITLPLTPAVTYTFDGYVQSLGGDLNFDGPGTFSCSIKVTGPVAKATA